MRKNSVVIRIDEKDLKELKKIFPSFRNESKAHYLKRYIQELKNERHY